MKDTIYLCAQVWGNVKAETIQRCWRKLYDGLEHFLGNVEHLMEMVNRSPGCEDLDNNKVNEWVAADDSQETKDHKILDTVMQTNIDTVKDPKVGAVNDRVTADKH